MNYALDFNGSDEYVNTSSATLTDVYVSVETWVKTNSATGDQIIVAMATSGAAADDSFILGLNTSDNPYFTTGHWSLVAGRQSLALQAEACATAEVMATHGQRRLVTSCKGKHAESMQKIINC